MFFDIAPLFVPSEFKMTVKAPEAESIVIPSGSGSIAKEYV